MRIDAQSLSMRTRHKPQSVKLVFTPLQELKNHE
jgi:hypothetical protein